MAPNELRQLLDQRPFHPFRIYLSDGSSHDIVAPNFAFMTRFSLYFAENFDEEGWPLSGRFLNVRHVTQVQELQTEPPNGDRHRE